MRFFHPTFVTPIFRPFTPIRSWPNIGAQTVRLSSLLLLLKLPVSPIRAERLPSQKLRERCSPTRTGLSFLSKFQQICRTTLRHDRTILNSPLLAQKDRDRRE